jgi:hypothetical protein
MKLRIPALALALALTCAAASPASAQFAFGRSKFWSGQLILNGSTTITAFHQGQYTNLGGNNPTNPNYLAGREGGYVWNNFFMFMIRRLLPRCVDPRRDAPERGRRHHHV